MLFTASAFRKLPSIYVSSYFPFGFEGRIWDLIVSVPDHCLYFYFTFKLNDEPTDQQARTVRDRSQPANPKRRRRRQQRRQPAFQRQRHRLLRYRLLHHRLLLAISVQPCRRHQRQPCPLLSNVYYHLLQFRNRANVVSLF